jgi:hypothetical protein
MSQTANTAIAVIGIDIGKNSLHVVGHDARGAIVLRQKWSRGQVEARLANIPRCLIGMEACVGAHHLSRKLASLGHDARLMPAKYVRCPCRKPHLAGESPRIGRCCCVMRDLCRLIGWMVVDLFRSRVALEAEILTLRQQINVLRRTAPAKLSFGAIDRLVFVGLYRLFPKVCDALAIVKPDTVIRWHRAGFRLYWRWKSRRRGGRPTVPLEIRRLVREMSISNPLWGAPRIHGELLKLGIEVGQTTVAKYMAKGRGSPSQGWKTFLRNHAGGIAAMDMFVVPTISFRLLYGLGVTSHPSAE